VEGFGGRAIAFIWKQIPGKITAHGFKKRIKKIPPELTGRDF
jgi:hypothetical protein